MGGCTGLYVHVPYCRSICPYCDFNVYLAGRAPPFADLAQSMAFEMTARAHAFCGPLASVYFGGGTPSLMPAPILLGLLKHARATFGLAEASEITVEADPGTVDAAYLEALRAGGVNRLSIGWQSSHDTVLRTLGRPHTAAAGKQAVAQAKSAGFGNINVDLIFAVPGQTLAHLQADLDALVALGPTHVSLYALTYHQGTPMARRLAQGRIERADDDLELAMMALIEAHLTGAGFVHYEVSNYARPGHNAVHNSLYWSYDNYLGVGPGAHSFHRAADGPAHRWGNTKKPADYIAQWQTPNAEPTPPEGPGCRTAFVEALTPQQMVLEQVLVGIRLKDGFEMGPVRALAHNGGFDQAFDAGVAKLLAQGWGTRSGTKLVPTPLGRDMADSAAALFVVDP